MRQFVKTRAKFKAVLYMLTLCGGGNHILAQELSSHVHGSAELNVAIAGNQLQLEFISPAMNLFGFERAPSSAAEAELIERIMSELLTAEWLVGDALSHCKASLVALESPEFTHNHSHGDESHGNLRAQYRFDCPIKLANELSLNAFFSFEGIREITVQWVSETKQGLASLTPNSTKLILE